MKRLILTSLFLVSTAAFAQGDDRTASASPHNLNVTAGFNVGGFTFGVGYEHMVDNSTGVGGHLRIFNKEDDNDTFPTGPGVTIIGGTLGHHFYKKSWDLAFTPSFNILMIDSPLPNNVEPEDATGFGPGLSISLTHALTDRVGLGFDFSNYWVWFAKGWTGANLSDMSAKLRISF